MGFSCSCSSTVALVRNLHTGHVSPQYHVVFDDKVRTIFNSGKTNEEMDKICDELFVSGRACYIEEEYDKHGVLVYEPPPLDDVWLSQPEKRDKLKALDRQRRINKRGSRIYFQNRN